MENIKRKLERGTYDARKAPQLWMYYVTEGAKLYNMEFDSGRKEIPPYFDKQVRWEVAEKLAEEAYEEIMDE